MRARRPEQKNQAGGSPRNDLQPACHLLAYLGQPADNGSKSGTFDALFKHP